MRYLHAGNLKCLQTQANIGQVNYRIRSTFSLWVCCISLYEACSFIFKMHMKDPAFLFYDGDASRDVSHMNRLERGAYFDIIMAQRKFGPMNLEFVKKILGKDFDNVWEGIKPVMTYVKNMYSISWLADSIKKRKKYCESRSKNRKSSKINKLDKNHMSNTCRSYVEHMENENENENKDVNINKNVKNINSQYFFLSNFLKEKILEQSPHAKITDTQLKNWSNDFRLMVERDKRTKEEIKYIIYRAFKDDFWKNVLRSASKLRTHMNGGKMDRLYPEKGERENNNDDLPAGV